MAAQIVKDFNALLEALIQQVAPLTGNSYHLLFKNLIKMNALLPIQTFNEHAFKWKKQIDSRDEAFFLNTDNVKNAANEVGHDISDNKDILDQIFHLQGVWNNLDRTSKDNLWEMLQALQMLGDQYKAIKG
jgi:hypothetical protein